MITRKSLGPYICLRCQRSLAKRSLPPHPVQTLSERRQYSQATVRKTSSDEYAYNDNAKVSKPKEKYDTRQGRLRGHRGLFQREDLEELRGATALGDQAKVIVLRDSIFRKYVIEADKPKIIKARHIDILGKLEEERGLVGEGEVTQNINAFRPQEADSIQDWEQLNNLTHALERSFTSIQLEKYIKDFKDRREIEKPPETWRATNPSSAITRITPWLPGISEAEDYFDDDPLREYYLRSHTPKQVLALRLLRECWGLELPALVDGIGQFEVELRKGDLDLLLLGPKSVLNTVHATHLQFEEERLEAYRSRNTIRVTTTSAKRYAIVEAIQHAVTDIQREEIDISALLPKGINNQQIDKFVETHLDDAALTSLGQLTNTKITRSAREKLQVSCIESNPNAASSQIDIVRRLVLSCDNSNTTAQHDLAIKQKESTTAALLDYTSIQSLNNWRQKLRAWMRYTAPISKKLPMEKEPIIVPDLSSCPNTQTSPMESPALATETEINKDVAKRDEPRHWGRYFTNTSALMGTILFSHPLGSELDASSTPLNTHGLLQTFSTKVPNLSRVLSRADLLNKNPVERLILRFQPDPFVLVPKPIKRKRYASSFKGIPLGIEDASSFPNIEMIFSIDRKSRESKLQQVLAIVNEKRTDVMQPENAVDVRFQQRTTSRLSRRFLKPIRNFLNQSQLNLAASKGRLDLPPSIILPISPHLCHGEGFKIFGDKQADKDVSGDRELQYLFTGLEVHSTLYFDWRSFRVSYTSIEAGKAAGRRAELKIRPIKQSRVAKEKVFVAAAYKLADMLGDGSGEHVDFDNVKTVSKVQREGGLRNAVHAKKPKLLFGYFSGKFKINKGVGGEPANWEESEEVMDVGKEEDGEIGDEAVEEITSVDVLDAEDGFEGESIDFAELDDDNEFEDEDEDEMSKGGRG